jgi:hypothetical protein
MMVLNQVIKLANDEFGNMEDYRAKHSDPMA